MKLSCIEVNNFKALKELKYAPEKFSCIVGENNAGKSSLLQAITLLINRPNTLNLANFYSQDNPISITGTFTGVTENDLQRLTQEHQEKIRPVIIDNSVTIKVTFNTDGKQELSVLKLVPCDKRFTQEFIDETLKGKKGTSLIDTFKEHYPDITNNFTTKSNSSDGKNLLHKHITNLDKPHFADSFSPLPSNMATSIKALLPEVIYVPAVKNINDEIKTTQTTSFGRLLSLLLNEISSDLNKFEKALEELDTLLNKTQDCNGIKDTRHEHVKNLESTIESFLAEHFPAAKIELRIPPPELKSILSSAQIFIDDGSKDLIDNKGDGIKRSLMFALLRTYVSGFSKNIDPEASHPSDSHKQKLIFLFEEPELYLHPRAQKLLFSALDTISSQHQVIITTHSPLFFEPGATASFARITKLNSAPKPVSQLYPISFHLDLEKAETFRLAKFEHCEAAFFSSAVVLFEGESDEHFLQHLSKIYGNNYSFEKNNVSLVRVGGKGNFPKYRKFFSSFGIPVITIADLDCLVDGYEHLNSTPDSQLLRNSILQKLDNIIIKNDLTPTLTARRIRQKTSKPTWKDAYQNLKNTFTGMGADEPITTAIIEQFSELFSWEQTDKRLMALQETQEGQEAIKPLILKLREENIIVLSKGAIEDYYPAETQKNLPKPQRALEACRLINSTKELAELSKPIKEDEDTELEEIFKLVRERRTNNT